MESHGEYVKILFISNTDGALYVFRRQLLKRLLIEKYRVGAITSDGEYVGRLSEMGVRMMTLDFAGTSASFPGNMRLLLRLRKLIAKAKPDIVHNFTHKPAIFGTLAARVSGVEHIFITITGLGKLFTYNDLGTRLLKSLLLVQYRIALRFATRVFFLNSDDSEYFIGKNLIPADKATMINGEGVDLQEVGAPAEVEIKKHKQMLSIEVGRDLGDKIIVVFNARALKEKGVNDFYEAARIIGKQSEQYVFLHLGLADNKPGSPLTKENLECYSRECGVHYLGFKDNIQDYMTACDVAVLPSSYREGVPRSLIEALALDKYIITTNAPGCRETLIEGWNGAFCKKRDPDDLAAKILHIDRAFLQLRKGRSRDFCESKFDVEKQIDLTLNCYAGSRDANG